MNSCPQQAMLAQVAISYGDTINAYRIINENLSLTDSIELLAQSPKYKKILPVALGVYTANGARIGAAIASFPEFNHRRIVARELTDIVEENEMDIMEVTEHLEDPHVKEQLTAVKKQFHQTYKFMDSVNSVNPTAKLTVRNAVYGQSATTDRMINETSESTEIVTSLQMAIDGYNARVYLAIVDEIFGLFAELENKSILSIIHPGIKANDVGLVQALRSFANRYQSIKDKSWSFSCPEFHDTPDFAWDKNTLAEIVRRAERLFETGRVSFVEKVINRMNGNEYRKFGQDKISETPAEILEAAERIKDAKLPEEVYIALGTEFENMSLVGFANRILQEPVLKRIRAIDKMGAHLGKAAIAYTACHGTPEDVQYVADNILSVSQLGKSKPIFKVVMSDARHNGNGAARLGYFLPEGINVGQLPTNAKKAIRKLGFGEIKYKDLVHRIIAENPEALKRVTEEQLENIPRIYGFEKTDEIEAKLREWLGLKVEGQTTK